MTRQVDIGWQDEDLWTKSASGDNLKTARGDSGDTAGRGTRFGTLYRRYVGRIYTYCFRRTGNRADAEDLTEQVFTEALEKWRSYEEQGKAAAWLFSIAHSRVVDYYRRQRHDLPLEKTVPVLASVQTPERQLMDAERQEQLFAVLERLDDDKRELILLRFGAELSFQEIGEIVGKREAAVKMATYRVLDELRAGWYLPGAEEPRREEDHE